MVIPAYSGGFEGSVAEGLLEAPGYPLIVIPLAYLHRSTKVTLTGDAIALLIG
jgi:hypothetical protein